MTRYTQLRHAGYYNPELTNKQRDTIAAQVDGTVKPTATPTKVAAKKGNTNK